MYVSYSEAELDAVLDSLIPAWRYSSSKLLSINDAIVHCWINRIDNDILRSVYEDLYKHGHFKYVEDK